MRIKIVATDQLIAFTKPPVFNYSLAPNGSNLQVEVGGEFAFVNQSGNCFSTNTQTQNGYSFNSQALPFEIIAETNQGDRLFRGFFDEYTTVYDPNNKDNTKTTLIFNDCSRFLNRRPITGSYRNTFQAVLEEIVGLSQVDGFITPIIYRTSTTKALVAVKKITFTTLPKEGDIVIVGKKRYKYVIEATGNPLELNIETDFGLMVNELVGKINSTTDSECTANEDGMGLLLTGLDYNNNFLVYTDGTRVVNTVLQDASSSDASGTVIDVLDLHVNIDFEGEDLRQCLEKLCAVALCNFYIDPKFGNLIIYQQQYYIDNTDSLRVVDISSGALQCLDNPAGIINNASYTEATSIVNKVIIWGKNGEIPLSDLRLEDPHVTITNIEHVNRDIPKGSTATDYFYNENAVRVLQVKITPKQVIATNAICYDIPVSLNSSLGFNGGSDTITINPNIFIAVSQFTTIPATTETEKYIIVDLDLTGVPIENSKSTYIKLSGIINFQYDGDDFGENFEAEIDFYLYTPTEVILLEKVRTHTILASDFSDILAGETIAFLNNYKGSQISIKAVARLISSFTNTPSFRLAGNIECLDCEGIPIYLVSNNDQCFTNSTFVNNFNSFTIAGRFFDPTLGSFYIASRSGSVNYKIDLSDPQYFIGSPYIKLTGLLNGNAGFGAVHLETSLLINGIEVLNKEINSITGLSYKSNFYLDSLLGTVVDVVINHNVSIGDDGNLREISATLGGEVLCMMANECISTDWIADGIMISLPQSGTRNGFRINADQLSGSNNGSFRTTVNLPSVGMGTYNLHLAFYPNIPYPETGSPAINAGVVYIKINNTIVSTIILVTPTGQLFNQVNLAAYAGQEIEIVFEYDGSNYEGTFPTTGYYDFYPIGICPNPEDVLPSDFFGNYQVNSSGGTVSFNHDVKLSNPTTDLPALCTFVGFLSQIANTTIAEIYVNEILQDTLTGSLANPDGKHNTIIVFDSSLAGETINIKIVLTSDGVAAFSGFVIYG